MRLLIVGSRSIANFDLSPYVPSEAELIISGGASGIDTAAEAYADSRHLSKLILRPQYEKYGRAAPIRRNEAMVEQADHILVVWDAVSKGTLYTIRYARKQHKEITVVMKDGTLLQETI